MAEENGVPATREGVVVTVEVKAVPADTLPAFNATEQSIEGMARLGRAQRAGMAGETVYNLVGTARVESLDAEVELEMEGLAGDDLDEYALRMATSAAATLGRGLKEAGRLADPPLPQG